MKKKKPFIIGAIALAVLISLGFLSNYLVSVKRYKDAVSHIAFGHAVCA